MRRRHGLSRHAGKRALGSVLVGGVVVVRCGMLVLILALLAGTGCSHAVYSPPVRLAALETPKALVRGENAARVNAGGGGALFGPEGYFVNAGYRRGLGRGFEAAAETTIVHLLDETSADTHPGVYSLRLGGKWAPPRLRGNLALTGGIGPAGFAGGAAVAGDLGLILAYENRYVVPFGSAVLLGSVPLSRIAVDTSEPEDPPGTYLAKPLSTWGTAIALGVRVPVGRWNLYGAGFQLHLRNRQDTDTATGFTGGVELRF